MRKYIAIIVIVLTMALTGCESIDEMEKERTENSDFAEIKEDKYCMIYYHKATKVMYIVSQYDDNHAIFTVMLDADGKPLLYEEE